MSSGPLLVYTMKPQTHLDSLVSHTFVKGAQLDPVSPKSTTTISNYSSLPRPIQTTTTSSNQLSPGLCHTEYHGVSHHLLFFMSRRNSYLIISEVECVWVEVCMCIHSCVSVCMKDGNREYQYFSSIFKQWLIILCTKLNYIYIKCIYISLSHSEVANHFRTGTDLQIWPSHVGVLTSLRKVQCLAAKSLLSSEYLLTIHWDVFWKMLFY